MINFTVLSLLSPIFVTFLMGGILLINKFKSPKFILGCFMLISFSLHVAVTIYQSGNFELYRYFDGLFMSSMLLMHPVFYFYVCSLTTEHFSIKRNMFHLIPAVFIFFSVFILYLLLSKEEQIYYLGEYMNGNFVENQKIKLLYLLFRFSKYVYLMQTVTYIVLIFRLLKKHKEKIQNMFSSENEFDLNWLFTFSLFYFIVSINSIVINFIPTYIINTKVIILNISLLIFSVFYFVIGFLAMRQKPVMETIENLDDEFNYKQSSKDNLENIAELVNEFIITKKVYLNPDLRIWDICLKVNVNRTYVSKAINEVFEYNFNDYINKLRVEEACNLIRGKAKEYTFEAISDLSGFKSLSSFNRAFKRFVKLTPSEYKDK